MKKTKSVGGKELTASDFAYVGDPNDIGTWSLPIPDEAHVRDALARFNQTQGIPASAKAGVIRKLLAAAKKYGIDASGFESEHKSSQGVVVLLGSMAASLAVAEAASDGKSWPVVVMQSGFASGQVMTDDPRFAGLPHYFPQTVVAQVAEACAKARFGRRHPETQGDESDPSRIAGWLDGGKMDGNSARATMHLFDNEKDLQAKLTAAQSAGKLDLFGASILGLFAWRKDKAEGRDALVAQKLARLISVDLVTEAGAGGKILPYAASRSLEADIAAEFKEQVSTGSTGRSEGGKVKTAVMKVLEALRRIDAGRAAELTQEFEKLPEDQQPEFLTKVTEAFGEKLAALKAADPKDKKADEDVLARANEALSAAQQIQRGAMIDRKIGESKLPEPAVKLVREHLAVVKFDGKEDDKLVDAEIVRVREAFAAFATVGKRTGGTVEVGRESLDKIQLAMDAMLGVKEARSDKGVRPFRGIREAYQTITGERELRGGEVNFFKTSEAVATSDFPNILLNSMTKKLLQDYAELAIVDQLDKLYVSSTLADFKTQDRVRMGYISDLSTVNEAAAYTEGPKPTDEKISYTIAKRGNLFTISEETIRNDDLGKIAQYPARIARAGRHTFAAFVSSFFSSPPNFDPDGVAWFHATHSNLGSTALASSELDARSIILAKQSEKDSGNRLGLPIWGIMIPVDLRPTALQINNNETGTNNYYAYFGQPGFNPERIIVNPLLTDVTDWFYFADPSAAPFLEIGFLDGYATPQIFLANLPTQGTQFTNDQIQYKVKHVYGGDVIDYRGVGKEVVAG